MKPPISLVSRFSSLVCPKSGATRQFRRECVAVVTMAVFLNTQVVFPLAAVYAQTLPPRLPASSKATPAVVSQPNASQPNASQPNASQPNASQPKKAQPVRLAQAPREKAAAQATENEDHEGMTEGAMEMPAVSVLRLDLSKVPTEAELKAAGGAGGTLTPLGNADVEKFKTKLAKQLELRGPRALDKDAPEANLDPQSAAGKVMKQARDRVKRLEDINMDFGRGIAERNEAHFREAAKMSAEHLEKFPDSPWAGEAMLHLGVDAQYNGRPGEARARYRALLENTSNDPTDPTYEMHQKAAMAWTDMDIMLGQWNAAAADLQDIATKDISTTRRLWASSWLNRVNLLRTNRLQLADCGTEALGFVLAQLGHKDAAKRVEHMAAPREAGFNLEELSRIAAQNGLKMRGFRAQPKQLAELPLPLIVHFDIGHSSQKFEQEKRVAFTQSLSGERAGALGADGAVLPCCHPVEGQETPPTCPMPGATPAPKKQTNPTGKAAPAVRPFVQPDLGHFLVVHRVDKAKKRVALFDPQNGAPIEISFDQFAREWSGAGLMLDKAPAPNAKVTKVAEQGEPKIKSGAEFSLVTLLSKTEMTRIYGGCCCSPRAPDDNGPGGNNQPGGGGPPTSPCGTPAWSVNRLTHNMFVEDVPIWYRTPIGPDVSIHLFYNSQDSEFRGPAWGNKWQLGYMTNLVEVPNGWVYLNMPGGATDIYVPQSGGVYVPRDVDVHNQLVKITGYAHRFELRFPTGEKYLYDTPPSINTPYPVLLEEYDRWGNKLTFTYAKKTISTNPLNETIHITKITDAQGLETKLTYDSQGHCTQVQDPFKRRALFTYNTNGNLTSAIDMGGKKFEYL